MPTVAETQTALAAERAERERVEAELIAAIGDRDHFKAAADKLIEQRDAAVEKLREALAPQEKGRVVAALCEASLEVGAVPKGPPSKELGYAVRSYADIMAKAQGAFSRAGIAIVPDGIAVVESYDVEVGDRGKKWRHRVCEYRWKVWHTSGEWIPIVTMGEARDGGDKGLNKCQTAAYKYAVIAALSLGEHANDPDAYAVPEASGSYDSEPAVTQESWASWADVRAALRGTEEGKEFGAFLADNGVDLSKMGSVSQRLADVLENKARELLQANQAAAREASRAVHAPAIPSGTPADDGAETASQDGWEPQEGDPVSNQLPGTANVLECSVCNQEQMGEIGDACLIEGCSGVLQETPF